MRGHGAAVRSDPRCGANQIGSDVTSNTAAPGAVCGRRDDKLILRAARIVTRPLQLIALARSRLPTTSAAGREVATADQYGVRDVRVYAIHVYTDNCRLNVYKINVQNVRVQREICEGAFVSLVSSHFVRTE